MDVAGEQIAVDVRECPVGGRLLPFDLVLDLARLQLEQLDLWNSVSSRTHGYIRPKKVPHRVPLPTFLCSLKNRPTVAGTCSLVERWMNPSFCDVCQQVTCTLTTMESHTLSRSESGRTSAASIFGNEIPILYTNG